MTELAGKTIVTVNYLAIDDYSASYTCTEGDHYEILHSPGGSVRHLAHSSGIGVVGQGNRDSSHRFLEHCCEVQGARPSPGKVDGVLDVTCVVIGVWSTYTDSSDSSFRSGFRDDLLQRGRQFGDIWFYGVIRIGADDCLGNDGSAGVHDTAFGGLSTYVDSYYEILLHIHLTLRRYPC